MKKIPFCDYKKLYLDYRQDYLNIFDQVASNGGFIMQKEKRDFEKELAEFIGCKYSIGVANCTDALEIGWQSIGLRKGDEVICSSHTFIATASSIVMAGGIPVPVEIGEDNLIDPDAVSAAINSRTVGIMPTQLNGRTCNMDKIMSLADKYKLFVVEDSAQALGSKFKGKHSGTFGNVGAISFYPAKVMGCFGDGGAVITNRNNLAKKIKHLANTAKIKHKWEYIHDNIGYNLKMPSLNAALGLAQISKIDIFLKAKRKLFYQYSKNFNNLIGIRIFREGKNLKSNYWLQTLILDNKYKNLKNKLLNFCYKKKIFIRPTWKLISNLKPYKKKQKMNLSGAKNIVDRAINLPSSQSLIINKS